jgi:hypothetical protein
VWLSSVPSCFFSCVAEVIGTVKDDERGLDSSSRFHDVERRWKEANRVSRRKEPFAQPFEPIHQNYNRDDYISPMTGDTYGVDREFPNDTSYHGGGGMPENKRGPPTSFDIARSNPFTDNAEAAPPASSAPRGYSDVARQNPFSDRNRMTPPKPLSERAYADVPSRLTPSPNTSDPMRARTMPLVNEMDTDEDFSRTWAKASAEHGFDGDWDDEEYDDDDDEDDDSEHGHIQIATRVNIVPPPPSTKTLDREVQSESLRQVEPSAWEAPHLRTVRSDISSLHHSPEHQQRNNNSAPAQYQKHNASTSSISSYRGTPTPAMQAAALSRPAHPLEQQQSLLNDGKPMTRDRQHSVDRPVHPLEQELSLLADEKARIRDRQHNVDRPVHPLEQELSLLYDEKPIGRDRQDSVDTAYLPASNLTRNSSSRSSLLPGPPSKASLRDKRVSFGQNNPINEESNLTDGWRGSGMDGYGASPAWSGIGGGWLEGQSGMAMSTVDEVPTPDEEPYELPASGPNDVLKRPTTSLMHSTSTIKRRPVSGAVPNSPAHSRRKSRSESVKSKQSWFEDVDEE